MVRNYKEAPTGSIYGKWEVLDYSHMDNEHYWSVKCLGCGRTFVRRASQLVRGRSKSCKSCVAVEREQYSVWDGIEGMSKQYLTKLKYRGKEMTVSLQDLSDQWKNQKGVCPYSGEVLKLVAKDIWWSDATASLDRIDSSVGYTPSNIQWVHKRINTMKNDMSEKEFLEWCSRVVRHTGGTCGS